MKRLNLLLLLFLLSPIFIFSQEKTYSKLQTNTSEVKIPGEWKQLNKMDDSGQTYLKNKNGVIIAIAQNPQNAYPFFKIDKTENENLKSFYKWDSEYRKGNNFNTMKIKENPKLNYIIWKYNDGKNDNVFLFGTSNKNFLNLLVYTDIWNEDEKIKFLVNLYEINK